MPGKLIACYSSHPQGVALVDALARDVDAEPAYWIGGLPDFKHIVETKFPGVVYQTQFQSNVNGPPDCLLDSTSHLDEVLKNSPTYEQMTISIMDRFLFNIGIEGHLDKISHFYYLLDRYSRLLKKIKPVVVYFGEVPHSLGTFTLYNLCRQFGIKTVISAYTCFADRVRYIHQFEQIGNSIGYNPAYVASEKAKAEAEKLIQRMQRTNYTAGQPWYMAKTGHRNPFYILPKLDIFYYKWKLERYYKALTKNTLPTEPFIYVPLHYQPELSTAPMGDIFNSQWLMIRLISENLPKGWKIVIKEHPSQVGYTKSNQRFFRSRYFYKTISELPGVHVLPTSFNSFEILDAARMVATITGTVAMEAVLRGKYCIMTGWSPFQQLDGIYHVRDNAGCRLAFEDALKGGKPSVEKCRSFLQWLYDQTLPYRIANDTEGFDIRQHLALIKKQTG